MPKNTARPASVTGTRAIDFEAPITITVSGRLAAALRFTAYMDGETPEQTATETIVSRVACDLGNSFGFSEQNAEAWIRGQ